MARDGESEDELIGQVLLDKLEVIRLLGCGGMGNVYEVEHRLTGHRRALKLVRSQFAGRPRFMKRLLREAKVAGTLNTQHVVETFDAGRLDDGSAYILMELLEGASMYDVTRDRGVLHPRRLANIMAQVAEGMAVAHAAGIIHRDLKPENIFLIREDGDERVKILDFGVSKFNANGADAAPSRLTAEGTLVGTPYYMSPEQAAGATVDERTDVYAMGVMMYEALSGRLPYEASSVGELFVKIGGGACVPLATRRPDLDPRWTVVVHRAFAREAEERFQTVEALRRELLMLAGGGSTAARAKTISDGAGPLPGRSEPPFPRPPATPTVESVVPAAAAASLGARDSSEDIAPLGTMSAPSAPERGVSPWLWAVGTFVVALSIGVLIGVRSPAGSPGSSAGGARDGASDALHRGASGVGADGGAEPGQAQETDPEGVDLAAAGAEARPPATRDPDHETEPTARAAEPSDGDLRGGPNATRPGGGPEAGTTTETEGAPTDDPPPQTSPPRGRRRASGRRGESPSTTGEGSSPPGLDPNPYRAR